MLARYVTLLVMTSACRLHFDEVDGDGGGGTDGDGDIGGGSGPRRMLAVSSSHTCAIVGDGAVRCWGAAGGGQLGNGDVISYGDTEPARDAGLVPLGGRAVSLHAGQGEFTCAILDTGAVRCWGYNGFGQLGIGSMAVIGDDEPAMASPELALTGTIAQLELGGQHACARIDDTVRCWGWANWGQLGRGDRMDIGDNETLAALAPIMVGAPVAKIAAGGDHTCALTTSGTVRCWGWNMYGQLGQGHTNPIGDTELPSGSPDVDVGAPVVELCAAYGHTCALTTTGGVRCWGRSDRGQLGYANTAQIGDDEPPSSAGDIMLGGTAKAITCSALHNCALLDTGAVRCWGSNVFGSLGYGSPAEIGDNEAPASAGDVPIGGPVVALSSGAGHTCAVMQTGALRCWGPNDYGQLGYGHINAIGDDEPAESAGDVPYQ